MYADHHVECRANVAIRKGEGGRVPDHPPNATRRHDQGLDRVAHRVPRHLRGVELPDGLGYDTIGESVGFFRLSGAMAEQVAAGCERYVAAGRDGEMYEAVLRDLLLDAAPGTFGYEDVTGLPWIEIDFPEDVQRAEKVIYPALQSLPQPA